MSTPGRTQSGWVLAPKPFSSGSERYIRRVPRSGWVKPESDRRLSALFRGVADAVSLPSRCRRCGGCRAGGPSNGSGVAVGVLPISRSGMARYSDGSYEACSRNSPWFVVTTGWEQSGSPPRNRRFFQARFHDLGSNPWPAICSPPRRWPRWPVRTPLFLACVRRRLVAIDGTSVECPTRPRTPTSWASTIGPRRAFGVPCKRGCSRWPMRHPRDVRCLWGRPCRTRRTEWAGAPGAGTGNAVPPTAASTVHKLWVRLAGTRC